MYRKPYFFILITAFVCLAQLCVAQVAPPIPRFQTIGINDGLSQSSVYAMLQDKRGFMWIGTADGLNRYDGSTLRVFRVPSPAGTLPCSYVRQNLCEDDSGNIWFANEFGIHCWDAKQDRIVTRGAKEAFWEGGCFYAVYIQDPYLWAYNPRIGFLRFDIRNGSRRYYPLPKEVKDTGMAIQYPFSVNSDGKVCFKNHLGGSIQVFDTRSAQFGTAVPRGDYNCIFFGRGKHYLIATSRLCVYDSTTQKSELYYSDRPLMQGTGAMQVVEDRWGRVWISSSGEGITCFDPAAHRFERYQHSNVKLGSIPIDIVPTLYIDRSDNLWAGTDGGGVCRLDLKPPRFNLFPLNEGDYAVLKDYFTKSFYEDRHGNIWFGTHSHGFCRFNPQTGALENYLTDAAGRNINIVGVIQEDQDGNMWLGHCFGFSIFDPVKRRFEHIPIEPRQNYSQWSGFSMALCTLKNGKMLAATASGPVLFSRENGKWRGHFTNNRFLNGFSTSVCQTRDGSLWVTNKGGALFKLAEEADTLRIIGRYLDGLNVRGLHPDELYHGLLWICSSNGLIQLNIQTGETHFWGEADGLSNAYLYGILEDRYHNFWISSNGGLIYYDRKTGRFATYTYADGLQSNEFNSGAYYKSPSGKFFFGGIRGFNWFEGDRIAPPIGAAPAVALLDFAVNGKPVLPAAHLSLPHDQNSIGFRIAVLDYSRPEANKVAYFLEGWDKTWIEGREHKAHYSSLPAGNYRLHIKGCNAAGAWSSELLLPITIAAPFWQTPVFYVSIAIMFLCTVSGVIVLFVRRKLRKERAVIERQRMLMEERARISKDMHDEIGSGLTRIAMMSEVQAHLYPESHKIAQSARVLVQNMSEIIWTLNPAQDNLESLLAYLREQIHSFLDPFELSYTIDFPTHNLEQPLSNVQRRNIYLTAKEAVNNALKHAEASALYIAARLDGTTLCFEVRDDGRGYDEDKVRRSANGLRNMRRRMEEMGGYFSCTASCQGTIVSFGIPFLQRPGVKSSKPATTFFTLRRVRQKNTFDA